MKLLTNKHYRELVADSHENTAREITIINLENELKKKEEELLKKEEYIRTLKDKKSN